MVKYRGFVKSITSNISMHGH